MLCKIMLVGLLLGGALLAVSQPAQAGKEKSITLTQIGRYSAGKPLLVVSHEVSNTTTIFEIDKN
jgi:hypothetical protein